MRTARKRNTHDDDLHAFADWTLYDWVILLALGGIGWGALLALGVCIVESLR